MKKLLNVLGPGLLYAGAAVGVSHLVQSTKAGALFNFDLVWVLLLANFLKYPFFEYGARYALVSGTNLVDGYRKVGKWAVVLFSVLTVGSMFILQAGVTVVTVGLLAYILDLKIGLVSLSFIVLSTSVVILFIGKFRFLDKLMKFIILLLTVSTVVAVVAAWDSPKLLHPDFITHFDWSNGAHILFLIAFVGWMPAPIDLSVWSSLWTVEKNNTLDYKPALKDTLLEFRIGYIGTALLATGFVALGALIMWGTGEALSSNGSTFSGQLISMYTESIGSWAYWVISVAALTTMFSTTLTVLDAYPRVLNPITQHLFVRQWNSIRNKSNLSRIWQIVLVFGTTLIIAFAASSMGAMVTIATSLSFVTAPILAWLNYKVVTDQHMPLYGRPGLFLRILSWIGISFFSVFTLIYFYWVFVL